jgi:hypothetical protein
MWATLALAAVTQLAPAAGELEFKNIRATYGPLGQERKDDKVLPGDYYFLHFDIDGLTVGDDDRIKYSMAVEFLNKKGESQFKKDAVPQETVNNLGGNRVPAFANVAVGLDVAPGEYSLTVTVTDLGSKSKPKKELTRKFEVLDKRFGLVRLGFAYPLALPEPPPAPPLGVVGENLILHFTAIEVGLNEKTRNPDLTAEIQILDESGKPTMRKPLEVKVQEIDDVFRKYRAVPMSFPISLNRTGKFKINFSVTDKISGKKAENSLDLTVVEIK